MGLRGRVVSTPSSIPPQTGGFLRNSRKYGLGSLRKTPTEGIPPRPIDGVPSMGVFLRNPRSVFGENHGKLQTARSTSVTGVWTWHLLSSSFERYRCASGRACAKRNLSLSLLKINQGIGFVLNKRKKIIQFEFIWTQSPIKITISHLELILVA